MARALVAVIGVAGAVAARSDAVMAGAREAAPMYQTWIVGCCIAASQDHCAWTLRTPGCPAASACMS